MSLSVPRSSSANSKRNSARLDLLTTLLTAPSGKKNASSVASDSPRDSLSPLDEGASRDELVDRGRSRSAIELFRLDESLAESEASTREDQTKQDLHIAFQQSPPHEVATVATSTEACLPLSPLVSRDHRPTDLTLDRTNGLTALAIPDLKRQISSHAPSACTTIAQVVNYKPKRRPKTPVVMGNKPSSISGSPDLPVDSSVRSVVRNPVRVLRKSSTHLFQRMNSKSPLPPEVRCTTAIQVSQQVSASTLEPSHVELDESPVDPFLDIHRTSKSPEIAPIHSASTATTVNENTRPTSVTTAIRDSRAESRRESRLESDSTFVEELKSESEDDEKEQNDPLLLPPNRGSALSPTIPAPSPVPEDSPHKYGLKDRMDTPEVPEPEEITVVKARRRSSGLDIFNEAKSLQSASSFLNGLSTSRRRAEFTQRSTSTSHPWPRTTTPHPDPTGPERRKPHTFKPSGFALTLPLTLPQLKCYRGHARLLPTRNRCAPVECAVCHIDDEGEHYSCSWCALRMCRFCRGVFEERGVVGLKERIKVAEMGGRGEDGEGTRWGWWGS